MHLTHAQRTHARAETKTRPVHTIHGHSRPVSSSSSLVLFNLQVLPPPARHFFLLHPLPNFFFVPVFPLSLSSLTLVHYNLTRPDQTTPDHAQLDQAPIHRRAPKQLNYLPITRSIQALATIPQPAAPCLSGPLAPPTIDSSVVARLFSRLQTLNHFRFILVASIHQHQLLFLLPKPASYRALSTIMPASLDSSRPIMAPSVRPPPPLGCFARLSALSPSPGDPLSAHRGV